MTKSNSLEEFKRGVTNAPLWATRATCLLQAAHVLWEQIESQLSKIDAADPWKTINEVDDEVFNLHDPFLLLAGFGIETLLKAVLVMLAYGTVDGVAPSTAPMKLPDHLKTHDLVALARTAGMPLTDAESDLLKRLSTSIVWDARYPVATKPTPMPRRFIGKDDWIQVETLVDRIKSEYYSHYPKRPHRPPR